MILSDVGGDSSTWSKAKGGGTGRDNLNDEFGWESLSDNR